MPDSLSILVRQQWTALLAEGFAITSESDGRVELASSAVHVVVVLSPRGEFDVNVFREGSEPWEGWSYSGMVGRASAGRLLDIALAKMHAEPEVLRGDDDLFERLAAVRRADSKSWTAFYGGRGPRPTSGTFP